MSPPNPQSAVLKLYRKAHRDLRCRPDARNEGNCADLDAKEKAGPGPTAAKIENMEKNLVLLYLGDTSSRKM